MTPIEKVLIANRGEIATRIIKTCRSMGIATVAVFTAEDADMPFVAQANQAVRVDSYLDIDAIVKAVKRSGAHAVHPGYGFLAEDAAFAAACEREAVFIGPSAEVIGLLASKREAKRIAAQAGVPVIPGYSGADQTAPHLAARAREIGFPVLIKASAGGGGRGMRVAASPGELQASVEPAKREARHAFGDDTLLLEKYIDRARHVEFQILGDVAGSVIHLNERECSIQRRYQKIIEETPSPALTEALRAEMGAAAVAIARAVGYYNAGTVEFILTPEGRYYFLEVNTRIQVEHPITECVTGIDLVREQIRIARGETLPMRQNNVESRGVALECRLYAEDPDRDFLPTGGHLVDWQEVASDGVRLDSGVQRGVHVSTRYDAMLAKVITHAQERSEAILRMISGLRSLSVQGFVTNREFLIDVLSHPAFQRGEFDTHFLARYRNDLRRPGPTAARFHRAAIWATVAEHERRRQERSLLPGLEPGFRNNPCCDQWVDYCGGAETFRVTYRNLGQRGFFARSPSGEVKLEVIELAGDLLAVEEDGLRRRYRVVREGSHHHVHDGDGSVVVEELPRFADAAATGRQGGCVAPMPGKVIRVLVELGQTVAAGDRLVILEAMKMEHEVISTRGGRVEEVAVGEGDHVKADDLLVVIE